MPLYAALQNFDAFALRAFFHRLHPGQAIRRAYRIRLLEKSREWQRKLDGEIRAGAERFRGEIMKEIEFLEDEVVAIGVGLPLMDTRRFQKAGSMVHQVFFGDGNMQIRSQIETENLDEVREGAGFMLSYLSRLIRLLDEAYPGVLATIKIDLPLHKQPIWRTVSDISPSAN